MASGRGAAPSSRSLRGRVSVCDKKKRVLRSQLISPLFKTFSKLFSSPIRHYCIVSLIIPFSLIITFPIFKSQLTLWKKGNVSLSMWKQQEAAAKGVKIANQEDC